MVVVWTLVMLACQQDPDPDLTLVTTQTQVVTESNGGATIEIPIKPGVTSFLLTVSTTQRIAVRTVTDPDGVIVLDPTQWSDNQSLTEAIFVSGHDAVLNWPARSDDGPLKQGTYEVLVAVVDDNLELMSGQTVDAVIQTRTDANLFNGTVSIELMYAAGVADNANVVEATEAAVTRWAKIWGEAGLNLNVRYTQDTIDANLPDLYNQGSQIITAVSDSGNDDDILVIVGEQIGGQDNIYGYSGGIPGPLTGSERGAVLISWLANAGGDGVFDDADIMLYGETLAHEVGHYLGLFHPVEDGWLHWDALSDTPACQTTVECQNNLGDNLMFPYPICDWDTCTPQEVLTTEQRHVCHRYTGTL